MFEIHGWANISNDTYESDSAEIERIKAELDAELEKLTIPSGFLSLRYINGELFLHAGILTNRSRGLREGLLDLLGRIAARAPGTYGLFYWADEECPDPPGAWQYHVVVIARGAVSERFDPFLSPRNPVVED